MGIALGVTAGAVGIGLIVVSVAALGPAAPAAVVTILVSFTNSKSTSRDLCPRRSLV